MSWMRRRALHPLLLSAFPILFLFAQNAEEVVLPELLSILLVAWAIVAAAWIFLRLVLGDARRAALVASFGAILILSYGAIASLGRDPFGLRERQALVAWGILLVVGALLMTRVRRLDVPTAALNAVGIALVLLQLGTLAFAAGTAGVSEIERPEPTVAPVADAPSVYFILLDEHANPNSLRDMGHDASPFVSALATRGFVVADHSRSNYGSTDLSLSATLDMRYHETPRDAPGSTARYLDAINNGEVPRAFKAAGYSIEYVRPQGLFATGATKTADLVTYCGAYSPFEVAVITSTPLGPFFERTLYFRDHLDAHRCILDRVAQVAASPGRKFVYAHILAPHTPWIVRADGSRVPFTEFESAANPRDNATWERARALYVGEVAWLDERILETVDAIMAAEERPPVIIVQSDHGSALMIHPPHQSLPERYRILNAIHVPEGGPTIPRDLTSINTFRLILDAYLGTHYGTTEDRTFMPVHEPPYWVDVTDRVRFED